MNATQQIPLALEPRPALGREDFLVAPCNAVAAGWIDAWPDWPVPLVTLVGPAGSGKTHLAQVWRARSGAAELDPATGDAADLTEALGEAHAAVVDDAERLAGQPAGERGLFHLYNLMRERSGHLLLTARHPPSRWSITLPDLRSRLESGAVAALGEPDDALMGALLVKLFADRQLRPGAGAIDYLLLRMERSHAAACRLVARLDQRALAERRELRLPLVRAVLEETEREDASAERS
ncbi:HdaA/DnaA family protein [Aquibaculum arenosum]|uniref:DnaA/Hda family protein n=1 Tax=Aquibaculum arenosum TaxID=3032591 RepID=A0ABT5YQG1_9PROT|nr:DnaA/Hda family protein [Fodinicurvata sp. CAU 1616]MDF2097178.1 DnaA/Hda family protein [Fodinicurvata sp. CAU 1616]